MKSNVFKSPNVQYVGAKSIVVSLLCHLENINWAKEIKIGKKLYSKYPDLKFWNGVCWPNGFISDSLSPLSSKWGIDFLRKKWNLYQFNLSHEKELVILSPISFGETKCKVHQKPKSIKDFLK